MQTLAKQFYARTDEAGSAIINHISQLTSGYRLSSRPLEKGLEIEFIFRGETDYTLMFPYTYIEDQEKIRNYYKQFLYLIKDVGCISDIQLISDNFSEQELSKISTQFFIQNF